jgi:type VI protein secretion system component Hcp
VKKKKAAKAKATRNLTSKTLNAKQAAQVKGGRKAGGDQQQYLIVKMNDATVTKITKI